MESKDLGLLVEKMSLLTSNSFKLFAK